MALIRVFKEKDGTSHLLPDNGVTRKHISAHNRYAKDKWIPDDPSDPQRMTAEQELANLKAENENLKFQLNKSTLSDLSKNYDPDKAIQLINLIDTGEELDEFTKGENRKAVKEAREERRDKL